MSGWRPIASPTVSPGPVTTLRTPSGRPASAAELRDPQQAERRRRRGLDDDGVAGRERRAELPGRHLRRVVPGDHRADDAARLAGDRGDRALGRRRDLAVELVGRLGVPADAGGRLGHVQADRVGDRLAGVDRLDEAELARVRLDQVRPADEDPLAVARVQARPAAVVGRPAGGGDRDVDVGRAALRDLGDRPAGGRVLGHVASAAHGVAERAVDEHPRPEVQAVDVGPRFLDRRDERLGHGSLRTTTRRGRVVRSAS